MRPNGWVENSPCRTRNTRGVRASCSDMMVLCSSSGTRYAGKGGGERNQERPPSGKSLQSEPPMFRPETSSANYGTVGAFSSSRGRTPVRLSRAQTFPQASPIPSNSSSPTSPSAPALSLVPLLRLGYRKSEQKFLKRVAQLVVVVPHHRNTSISGASVAPKVERQSQRQE